MTGTEAGDRRALVARLLRQRIELGAPPLFLEDLGRDEALRLAGVPPATRRPAPVPPSRDPVERDRGAPTSRATGDPRASAPGPTGRGTVRGPGMPTPPGAPVSTGVLPVLPLEHDALRSVAAACERCGLSRTRTQAVFHDGVPSARLMVVGEAPGKNEDETGLPFVGAAGKLLDLLLLSIDLTRRESVYICNVLKCRPPGNRNPLPEEIEACRPILERQIEIVAPEVILAVGTFSAQWLTGSEAPLGKLRGEVYSYRGVPLVCTYHPAALLRNGSWTRATWDDLQLLRQVLDRGA